jgi:hypothetical protein
MSQFHYQALEDSAAALGAGNLLDRQAVAVSLRCTADAVIQSGWEFAVGLQAVK